MTDETSTPPAGWYPDPAGSAGWRVWTGSDWSSMTRPFDGPFGPARRPRKGPDGFEWWAALANWHHLGVPALGLGASLLFNVANVWNSTQSDARTRELDAIAVAGLALVVFGHLLANRALRALAPRQLGFFQRWPLFNLSAWHELAVSITRPHDLLGVVGASRRVLRGVAFATLLLLPWHGTAPLVARELAVVVVLSGASRVAARLTRVYRTP